MHPSTHTVPHVTSSENFPLFRELRARSNSCELNLRSYEYLYKRKDRYTSKMVNIIESMI